MVSYSCLPQTRSTDQHIYQNWDGHRSAQPFQVDEHIDQPWDARRWAKPFQVDQPSHQVNFQCDSASKSIPC